MKKFVIPVVAAVAVAGVATGTGIGVAAYMNQPKIVAVRALEGAMQDLLKREEIEPLVNTLKQGSLSLNGSLSQGAEKLEVGGKIYMNANKCAIMADELVFKTSDGTNSVQLTGSAYFSEDKFYISNNEWLKGTYGVVRGETLAAWEDSIFAPDSQSAFALPQETFNRISNSIKLYHEGKDKELSKKAEKIVKRYLKEAISIIQENLEFEEESKKIDVNGERVEARVITITVTAQNFVNILDDIYDYAVEDDDLRNFVVWVADTYEEQLSQAGVITDDINIENVYYELMNELSEEIDDMDTRAQTMESSLTFQIATKKNSTQLMKFSLCDSSGDTPLQVLSLEIGEKGIKNTDKITVIENMPLVAQKQSIYEIKENTDKSFQAVATVEYDDYNDKYDHKVEIFNFKLDKKDNAYKLLLPNEIIIKGTLKQSGDKTTITVNKVTQSEQEVGVGLSLTLIIDERDAMPKPSKDIKDISDVSAIKFEEVIEKIDGIFG